MATYDAEKVVVYCQGTFNVPNPSSDQQQTLTTQATALGDSGFGTVLLGFWHVSALGSISYGAPQDSYYVAPGDRKEYKLADLSWVLTNVPKYLKQAGKVTKVLLSFGGGGAGDLNGIKENLSTFQDQLTSLLTTYPDIDGIDCDFEKYLDDDHTSTLVSLVETVSDLKINGSTKIVTAAPYNFMDWWLSVLAQTQSSAGGGFAWWNFQWAQTSYKDWLKAIKTKMPHMDEAAIESFLIWNFANGDTSPAEVTSQLQKEKLKYPGLAGAYVWTYEGMSAANQTAQYAQAIINGLTESSATSS